MQTRMKFDTALRARVTHVDGSVEDYGIVSGGGARGALSRLKVRLFGPKKER